MAEQRPSEWPSGRGVSTTDDAFLPVGDLGETARPTELRRQPEDGASAASTTKALRRHRQSKRSRAPEPDEQRSPAEPPEQPFQGELPDLHEQPLGTEPPAAGRLTPDEPEPPTVETPPVKDADEPTRKIAPAKPVEPEPEQKPAGQRDMPAALEELDPDNDPEPEQKTGAEEQAPKRRLRRRKRKTQSDEPDRIISVAVIGVAIIAAVLYSWGIGKADLQPFYTAAVRSMTSNWHAFFYGALDPDASITIDKLPGAFWLQALSVKVFGLHRWAVALPQVIAAVLTVLVLYRVVREWAGRHAGLLAAVVFAITPITVVLARHSMPDTVLVFFLVCAAWAWQRAISTGRTWGLLLCGLFVGLAFETKMLQGWLVLPAFALTYLFAAPVSWLKRVLQLVAAGIVTVATSGIWVLVVALTPSAHRPFIDATADNNPLTMVLGYNALERFDSTAGGDDQANWALLLKPLGASQIGWLLPFALITLVVALLWTRGRRATWAMWGLWLLVHVVAFGASSRVHVYYTAALAPAIAALTGAGALLAWRAYRRGVQPWILPTAVALTALWAFRIAVHYHGFEPWTMAIATLGVLAAGVLAAAAYLPHTNERFGPPAAAVSVVALLITPLGWSVSTLKDSYAGTGSTPGAGAVGQFFRQQARAESPTHTLPIVDFSYLSKSNRAVMAYLDKNHHGEKYLVATERARLAEPFLRRGNSVLPMGGFSGQPPYPTGDQLHRLIAAGQLRYALVSEKPSTTVKVIGADWVRQFCKLIPNVASNGNALYDCKGR